MRVVRGALVALLVCLLVPACSSSPDAEPSGGPTTSAESPTSEPVAPLVGLWEQSAEVHTCDNFVRALDDEDLLPAVEPSPLKPGESWHEVAKDFCVPSNPSMTDFDVKHSHFFDELGNFGSLGQHGEQVDDGPYKIVNDDTMRIGSSTFHYDVTGDTLTLDPVITQAKRKEALAKPGDFSEAVWMVAVALPGTSWQRVDCGSWC